MQPYEQPVVHEERLPPTPPSEPIIDGKEMTSSITSIPASIPTRTGRKHVWIITGPAGCGKTSVANYLHTSCSLPYLEGDDVSPSSTQSHPMIRCS